MRLAGFYVLFTLLSLAVSHTTHSTPRINDIAVGYGFTCATDAFHTECFGDTNGRVVQDARDLMGGRFLAVGMAGGCGASDTKVQCWPRPKAKWPSERGGMLRN